jgi:hypothetical protein
MKKLFLIPALLVLSACGGSSHHDDGGPAVPPPDKPPITASDTFFSAVLAMIGMSPDDQEPASVDSVAATTPEATEPSALP